MKIADKKWQKVREIFDSALRLKPEERQKFVIETCGDDKTLLAEVQISNALTAAFIKKVAVT